jgi:hypothetical protein
VVQHRKDGPHGDVLQLSLSLSTGRQSNPRGKTLWDSLPPALYLSLYRLSSSCCKMPLTCWGANPPKSASTDRREVGSKSWATTWKTIGATATTSTLAGASAAGSVLSESTATVSSSKFFAKMIF